MYSHSALRNSQVVFSNKSTRAAASGPCCDCATCIGDTSATTPVTPLPCDEVRVDEEREFVWDDYLEETKSTAAPATSFKHVRIASASKTQLYSSKPVSRHDI